MSRKKIQNVDCYGEVKPDTSFIICCDNEDYDGVYADGNPNDEDYEFSNWDEVVTYLLKYYRSDIIQIETDSIKELLSNEQKNC